jgi:lipopolysaccharide/colanic/teichoic acid biosynthesis glycosyltransferase
MYKRYFKRLLSFSIAFVALICLGWLIIIVAILLHFVNKGNNNLNVNYNPNERKGWLKRWLEPVIFTQERPGKDAKIFKVIKFKTMTDERDTEGNLLPDAQRLTRVGRIVRSTSIDELPQLINVLKGDMALIGPRPLMPQYLELYSPEQMRRHEVRPGITGWAQINGRNAISFTERFKLDVWYVDHLTFLLDLKIFFMTILKIFKREGISAEGQATMEAFNGEN